MKNNKDAVHGNRNSVPANTAKLDKIRRIVNKEMDKILKDLDEEEKK